MLRVPAVERQAADGVCEGVVVQAFRTVRVYPSSGPYPTEIWSLLPTTNGRSRGQ